MVPAHHLSRRADCPLASARQSLIEATGIEAPVAGPDGYVWPVQRRCMRDHAALRVRLAEDIIAIWRDNDGHLQDGDLIRLGWAVDDNDTRKLAWRLRRPLDGAKVLAASARPDLIGADVRRIRRAA